MLCTSRRVSRDADRRNLGHVGARFGRFLLLLGMLSLALSLNGCGDLEGGPEIVTVSVDPSTIEFNHYNGSMEVLIYVAGFTGKIVEADAFIQLDPEPPRVAPGANFPAPVEGNMIRLTDIPRTWFQGLPPGTYSIGASVVSDSGEQIEQSDLATVTVTD